MTTTPPVSISEGRMAEILESCDLGDHNNRPSFHAHDECYVLSPRTAKRMAAQLLAALSIQNKDKP